MHELKKLSGADLRLLSTSTVSLLRVLFARRGPEGPPFEAELLWLADKAGVSRATAERGLKRLRDVGCLETERTYEEIDAGIAGLRRRASMNRYYVLGQYRVRNGSESFSIPMVGFSKWSKGRNKQGRPRKTAHLFLPETKTNMQGRPPKQESIIPSPFQQKSNDVGVVSRKGEGSYNIKEKVSLMNSPLKGGSEREDSDRPSRVTVFSNSPTQSPPPTSAACVIKLGGRHPLQLRRRLKNPAGVSPQVPPASPAQPSWADLAELIGNSPHPEPQPRHEHDRITDIPIPDVPQREYVGHLHLDDELTERQLVTALVQAFNAAHLEIFGKPGHAYRRPGSVMRSKVYPQLLNAAKALLEKGHPPQSWAEWRMKYYADNDKKCPPMQVVFGAKSIRSKSGWFRKSYDRADQYKSVITRLNLEQMYRAREAHSFNRGLRNTRIAMPVWYVKLRQDEIEKGAHSPIQFYPRLRASGGASRDYISTVSRSNWVDIEA